MNETLETEFVPIWVRRETHRWHWYDWDTSARTCTDMTETPKKFCSCILILHTWDCVRIKNNDENFFRRLSHIYASLCRGVSVISVSTVGFASQSYRSHLTDNDHLFGGISSGTHHIISLWFIFRRAKPLLKSYMGYLIWVLVGTSSKFDENYHHESFRRNKADRWPLIAILGGHCKRAVLVTVQCGVIQNSR